MKHTHKSQQALPITQYLNCREAYFPSFTSDGRHVAFLTSITGLPQVWRVEVRPDLDHPLWPDQVTFEADRVMGVWCSPVPGDERLIYSHDMGGSENIQFTLLSEDGADKTLLTAGNEDSMHIFGEWSSDGSQILYSANRRHAGLFDLYVHPLMAKATMLWENDEPGYLRNLRFSPDGKRVAFTRVASSFCHDLFEIGLRDGAVRQLNPSGGEARYSAICYAPDGKSLYLNTDLGSDFLYVARFDLETLSIETMVAHDWDVEFVTPSPNGQLLAYTLNVDGAYQIHLFDTTSGASHISPTIGTSPGVVALWDEALVFSPESTLLAFSFTSATQTSDIYIWDLELGLVRPVTRSSHAGIPRESFVAPRRVHYPTFDERQIPAWLYEPTSGDEGPLPVIVMVHGGPESQFKPFFHPIIQYFLHHGYAVFAPNVRGSTGYGKAYGHLDDVDKRMDSVLDLAQAARWLREQPGIDGERLVVYGGSYGGFMVLAALVHDPDLWAAGVDIVGISNFVTFLENTSEYRRGHREAEYGSLEHDREFLESISPLNHADKITAPLMVIHGANDPRVPLSEAEQLVGALKERAMSVEFLMFDDEGHGLVKLKNKLVAFPAIVEFLNKHLQR
jgi:dipeptidyl aminopeptidase/acylaminoacyl peptidase